MDPESILTKTWSHIKSSNIFINDYINNDEKILIFFYLFIYLKSGYDAKKKITILTQKRKSSSFKIFMEICWIPFNEEKNL